MRFSFTFEQEALGEAVGRCIAKHVPTWPDRRWVDVEALARSLVLPLAELGVPGIMVPEEKGGSGLGIVDAVPAIAAAAHLMGPYPFVDMLVASHAISSIDHDAAPGIRDGQNIAVVAWDTSLQVTKLGDGLTGVVTASAYGGMARWLLAPVHRDNQIEGAVLVDLTESSVKRTSVEMFDLTAPVCRIEINNVQSGGRIDRAAWLKYVKIARVLYAADMIGSATRAHELALGYLRTRSQFGKAIGENQSLRHMVADDHLRLENGKLAVAQAAWAIDADDQSLELAVLTAKAYASRAARLVAENAIQIHGGIGFTWDMPLHPLLRRILRVGGILGTPPQLFSDIGRLIAPLR